MQGVKTWLSFLKTSRKSGVNAVGIGGFETEIAELENGVDFSEVYRNAAGKECYWQFSNGDELRIYLDSVFFGQWFYALMVGFCGIRTVGEKLRLPECTALFERNMKFLARYFHYAQFDAAKHGMPAFLPRACQMDCLDNCGLMGLELVNACFISKDEKIELCLKQIAHVFETVIPRLPDGTFYRGDTMWADDLFMSTPFMARYAALTGEKKWKEECAGQMLGFCDRLYLEEEHLFSHIYFVGEDGTSTGGNGRIFKVLQVHRYGKL